MRLNYEQNKFLFSGISGRLKVWNLLLNYGQNRIWVFSGAKEAYAVIQICIQSVSCTAYPLNLKCLDNRFKKDGGWKVFAKNPKFFSSGSVGGLKVWNLNGCF